MSPVFRHGRLRLYLLKLLDESPRHGYEVIRLLQDRFMGVYAPSPGTIYPRLARLEEEGLVTHDEADGRKVYRITDKGREELRHRSDELSELEDEITASVRDIAREVTEDVRETVRNLREELTFAARDMHGRGGRGMPRKDAPPPRRRTGGASAWDEALHEQAQQDEAQQEQASQEGPQHGPGPQRETGPGWRGWPPGGSGWADPGTYRDLEQLARRFTRELRAAAAQAHAVREDAVGDLRTILDDALDRIKAEVFGAPVDSRPDASRAGASRPHPSRPDPSQPDPSQPDPSQPDPSQPDPSQPDPSQPDAPLADAPASEDGGSGGPR